MSARDDYSYLAALAAGAELGGTEEWSQCGTALDEIDRLRADVAMLKSAWTRLSAEYRAFEAATISQAPRSRVKRGIFGWTHS